MIGRAKALLKRHWPALPLRAILFAALLFVAAMPGVAALFLRTQKGIVIDYDVVDGATHFWMENLPDLEKRVGAYLDKRLAAEPA